MTKEAIKKNSTALKESNAKTLKKAHVETKEEFRKRMIRIGERI